MVLYVCNIVTHHLVGIIILTYSSLIELVTRTQHVELHVEFMSIAMSLLDYRSQVLQCQWSYVGEMVLLITPSLHVMKIDPLRHIVDQCDRQSSVLSVTSGPIIVNRSCPCLLYTSPLGWLCCHLFVELFLFAVLLLFRHCVVVYLSVMLIDASTSRTKHAYMQHLFLADHGGPGW